jgi:ParB/RepB/Spo0J family partition protein
VTSGTFNHVLISSITVERGERQRRELHKIEELADSIRRIGLIHPPVVTREHVLVAGERRFAAVSHLGWERIPVQYTDELSIQELRAIELEENIKRVDITWQEQVDAVKTFHNFQQSITPTWGMSDTAEALGYTPQHISQYLMVAKAIETTPSISAAPKVSTAIGIVQRANERRNDKELASIRGASEAVVEAPPRSIINESFLDWALSYDGPKFNFIHCDFPYGINADSFQQGGAVAHGGYEDSPDTYWTLCKSLASNLNRIASESCHLVFWYSMKYHCETINFLREETDFVVNPYPLVWHKTDNVGTLPDPSRGPRQCYEVALFAHRGDRGY